MSETQSTQCNCRPCNEKSGRVVDADGGVRPLYDTGIRKGDFNLAHWFDWKVTEVAA